MMSGKLNQMRNLKNLNPIHVLSIQTDIKSGGRVSMSTERMKILKRNLNILFVKNNVDSPIVSISNMKTRKSSVAWSRRRK